MVYRYSRGVSLFESLICLSLLGVIVSLAIPAFSDLLQRNRQQVAVRQLKEVVNFARAAAINGYRNVSICHAPVDRCEPSNIWSSTARVFSDHDRDGVQSVDELTLLITQLPEGLHWRWNNFRTLPHLTFLSSGIIDVLNGSFILCQDTEPLARLVLNKAGRIEVADLRSSDDCA